MSHFVFNKGDPVEVTKNNYYYPASVVRPPSKNKNLVFLEYLTLSAPSHPKRLREYVNVASVRPKLPLQLNPWFRVGDAVDAFRQTHSAWCPATVADILENSSYLVAFLAPENGNDSAVIHHSALRLHRNWVHGNWLPPLPGQEQPPEMETKPENLRFRIKYSRRPLKESKFKKGRIVEVSRDDESYKGAWFVATIVDIIGKDRFQVEYRDMKTNDGTQLLKEEIDARFIRPCPPEVPFAGSFKQFQEVDAWYNDGWWEAVVLEVLNNRECLVSFIHNDVLKFENSKLRPHQDWFDGKWVMSSKKSGELVKKFGDLMPKTKNVTEIKLVLKRQKPTESSKKPRDVIARTTNTRSKFVVHFCKGAKVEVRSDEEGYQDAWYTAIVVDSMQNDKYLVEYLTLQTDDLTEQLKEVAHASDIRPYPPDVNHVHNFALREMVDAWYNEGWWVGQVSSVLIGFKYKVYFWPTKEKLEFEHCHLRPHQDWIDGKWVLASLGRGPDH
ncbi:Tudor, plant [Spatholobus suberectus]|nr:Tudor, plant [Spatholobus suberectus]